MQRHHQKQQRSVGPAKLTDRFLKRTRKVSLPTTFIPTCNQTLHFNPPPPFSVFHRLEPYFRLLSTPPSSKRQSRIDMHFYNAVLCERIIFSCFHFQRCWGCCYNPLLGFLLQPTLYIKLHSCCSQFLPIHPTTPDPVRPLPNLRLVGERSTHGRKLSSKVL